MSLRETAEFRCMRWPFGALCLLELAGGDRPWLAVCRLHGFARRLWWLSGGGVRAVRR